MQDENTPGEIRCEIPRFMPPAALRDFGITISILKPA